MKGTNRTSIAVAGISPPAWRSAPSRVAFSRHWRKSPQTFSRAETVSRPEKTTRSASAPPDRRDGSRRQFQVIGQKYQHAIVLLIVKLESAGKRPPGSPAQAYRKRPLHPVVPRARCGISRFSTTPIVGVFLQTRHKINTLLGQAYKPFVVRIAAVKCQNRPPRKSHLSRHTYLMLFALRDHCEGRQIAIVVQQQMKFHFVRRNLAQSNMVAQRSITVASKLSRGFLKRNFLFFLVSGWLATRSGTSPAAAQTRCAAAAKADVHWRRPGWNEKEPWATPDDEVSPRWQPILHKFRATTWRAPADRRAWR